MGEPGTVGSTDEATPPTLAALVRRALTDLPLGALLHEAAPVVAHDLAVPLVAIWQALPGDGTLCLSAGVGWPEALIGRATIADNDADTARSAERAAMFSNMPLVVADLRADRRFAPVAALGERQIGGAALVAIPGEAHPVGVLAVYDQRARTFAPAAIERLREIAAILGAALRRRDAAAALREATGELEQLLHNATIAPCSQPPEVAAEGPYQPSFAPGGPHEYATADALRDELRASRVRAYRLMEERLAERTRQLTAIYAITAKASAPLALEALLAEVLDLVSDAVGATAGGIQVGEAPQLATQWVAARKLPGDELARPLADTALGAWLLANGAPLLVRDTSVDPRTAASLWLPRGRSLAAVPIRVRGRIQGALTVVRDWGRPFGTDEVALLAAVADRLGVAVENARLFGETQQRATREVRQALSRDLHDSLTQSLYSLTLLTEVTARQLRQGDRAAVEGYLDQLAATARQAMREMRLLIHELRAAPLVEESLADALERRLDAVERRAGIAAQLTVEGIGDLPIALRTELFQIAQEALNNVLKHAEATGVRVRLREIEGQVELSIADDGRGFDPERPRGRGGVGLVSMRERASALGGATTIEANAGGGTRVVVRVPLAQAGRSARPTFVGVR